MIDIEQIKRFLPQYLTNENLKKLISDLTEFPHNFDQRIYTTFLRNEKLVYQGDGFRELPFIALPENYIGRIPGMILSNTCDIDQSNSRLTPIRMVYAPIINLQKYEKNLKDEFVSTRKKSEESVKSHIEDIKKQYVSHIFFLPKNESLEADSIVLLDRACNLPSDKLSPEDDSRLFTLSDYGFYVFLFKLSVHFTRIREGVNRTAY